MLKDFIDEIARIYYRAKIIVAIEQNVLFAPGVLSAACAGNNVSMFTSNDGSLGFNTHQSFKFKGFWATYRNFVKDTIYFAENLICVNRWQIPHKRESIVLKKLRDQLCTYIARVEYSQTSTGKDKAYVSGVFDKDGNRIPGQRDDLGDVFVFAFGLFDDFHCQTFKNYTSADLVNY